MGNNFPYEMCLHQINNWDSFLYNCPQVTLFRSNFTTGIVMEYNLPHETCVWIEIKHWFSLWEYNLPCVTCVELKVTNLILYEIIICHMKCVWIKINNWHSLQYNCTRISYLIWINLNHWHS